jgi:hypothetical protein
MRRRRLLKALIPSAVMTALLMTPGRIGSAYAQQIPLVPPIGIGPPTPNTASNAPEETEPSQEAERPEPAPAATQAPADHDRSHNNIIGLNVARLRQDQYLAVTAELVNANGGDWGYVTAVWTAEERDTVAGEFLLRQFVDRCFEQHLQPIVRVATRFDTDPDVWSRPEPDDAEKWRAFLEKGKWPTRRVWIVAGNEPNLGRDWGGAVDAGGYARYLAHFLDVFADSEQFKVVNGPLDASNTTELPNMQDAYEFMAEMDAAVPGIFERLPAWASNPYRVLGQGDSLRYTHLAYEAELEAIGRDMPVIITEAGHLDTGDEKEIAQFYSEAFADWMADPRVIAVTPLFWHPDRGVFWMFDFEADGRMTHRSPTYDVIRALPRAKGSPNFVTDMENVARDKPGTVVARGRDARAQQSRPSQEARQVAAPMRMQVTNTDGEGARLRAEPARTARSIRVIPDGETVEAVGPVADGDGLRWWPVRIMDGTTGWIAASLLTPRDGNDEASD